VGCHIAPTCLAQSLLLAGEGWQDGVGHPDPLPRPWLGLSMQHFGVANTMSADGEQLCVAKTEINGNGTTFCSKLTSLENR